MALNSMGILTILILPIHKQCNCWYFTSDNMIFLCICMSLINNIKWLVFESLIPSVPSSWLLKLSMDCFNSFIVVFGSRICLVLFLRFVSLFIVLFWPCIIFLILSSFPTVFSCNSPSFFRITLHCFQAIRGCPFL